MLRTIPAIAAVLLTAACAAGHSTPPTPGTSKTVTASPSPVAAPTHAALPVLTAGQPVAIHTNPDGVVAKTGGSYQVTLLGIKTAVKVTDPSDGYTATAQSGDVISCLLLKVKNLSASSPDLYPFTNPQWVATSGQVAAPSLPMGVSCTPLVGQDNDLNGQPDPTIGQFTTGTDTLEFPTGSARLLFTDRAGTPLFTVPVPAAS